MTFCVAVKTKHGIVALADTQVTSGSERKNKIKLTLIDGVPGSAFIMTSGLRSVRDKTLTYLSEEITSANETPTKMYRLVDLFCDKLRLVREKDEDSLRKGKLQFNLHAIMGGKLKDDDDMRLFYIYPEGNWIESTTDSSYFVSGRTSYGRPILDRLLTYETNVDTSILLTYLAFDATRASVNDVDFPIDVFVYPDEGQCTTHRFESHDLRTVRQSWSDALAEAIETLPKDWLTPLIEKVQKSSKLKENAQ